MPGVRYKQILAGTRFGQLVVVADRLNGEPTVRCRCDCGNEIDAAFATLGHQRKSCGCLKLNHVRTLTARHGKSADPIYRIWSQMVQRCGRPTHPRYADYGGRGITVCDRWLDFANFYADMGDRPEGRSLDRRDNNAGYSPDNCRWATAAEQRRNSRPARRKEVAR